MYIYIFNSNIFVDQAGPGRPGWAGSGKAKPVGLGRANWAGPSGPAGPGRMASISNWF